MQAGESDLKGQFTLNKKIGYVLKTRGVFFKNFCRFTYVEDKILC